VQVVEHVVHRGERAVAPDVVALRRRVRTVVDPSVPVGAARLRVRTSTRPLSARAWRVANLRGAANATVAAAMARMVGVRADDRVANLMCGSGTLLIERLLAGAGRTAVGVDRSSEAIAAAQANVEAAGLTESVELFRCDIGDSTWVRGRRFDAILADPPWGTLCGDHRTNEAAHDLLLRVAHDVGAGGARLAVLTHEVKAMARVLARHANRWRARSVHKIFHKGHHPRIYVLERR
jgi:23S rRNA G2445 N2-methylase RlmL